MNVILFSETEIHGGIARVTDRRHQHVRSVHRAQPGDELRIGLVDGRMGTGRVLAIDDTDLQIEVRFDAAPPAPLALTLFVALPRPKVIPRLLQTVTSLGVKRVHFFNAFRVEKIYWSCRQLAAEDMRAACRLGLEQARDTILPEIFLHRLFKPFVEDELPALIDGTESFLAHPGAVVPCPFRVQAPVSLAIGPEGGFIDFEIDLLQRAGFRAVRTFERILKVETAIAATIGRLL